MTANVESKIEIRTMNEESDGALTILEIHCLGYPSFCLIQFCFIIRSIKCNLEYQQH